MAGMLDGKIAVVTGAGGGIGREIAIAMARAGAKVIINDIGASLAGEGRSASPAEETKRLIEGAGGAAAVRIMDRIGAAPAQIILRQAEFTTEVQVSDFLFSTCRPRYMPVLRSMWCGRRSSPESLSSI